jgi:ATP-binding cassette, subfamily B, bacterial
MSAEKNGKELAILSFHKIGMPRAGGWNTWFYIPEETFIRQLNDLKSGGWKVLNHSQFLKGLENPESLPERSALITFDDGYRSMLTVVLPVLRWFGYPAVLFVPTDYVGGRNTFDGGAEPDEDICDWNELLELDREGVSIQAHGVSHRPFSNLSIEEQRTELLSSKAVLENRLDKPVDIFAFPYGDDGLHPGQLRGELALAGYRAACLYRGGPITMPVANPYRLPRLAMGPDTNLEAALTCGEYIPLPAGQRAPGKSMGREIEQDMQKVKEINTQAKHSAAADRSSPKARRHLYTQAFRSGKRSRLRAMAKLYRTFGSYLKPYWIWFLISYTSMAVTVFLTAAKAYPLKWILDVILYHRKVPKGRAWHYIQQISTDPHTLLVLLCIGMVGLVVLQSLFTYVQRYMLARAARYANNDIRNHVFHHIQVLSLSFRGQTTSGDLMLRLTNDINELRKFLVDSVSDILRLVLTFAWIAVLMLEINWQLTLLAMAVVPAIFYLSKQFTSKVEVLTRVQRAKESEISAIIQENVSSMAVVHAFAQEGQEIRRFAHESEESLRADVKRIQISKAFSRVISILTALGTASVLYYAGLLALAGKVQATDLILFVPWLKELYSPMATLSDLLTNFAYQLVCGERIAEILEMEGAVKEAKDAVPAPQFRGEVRFDHVTFGYKKDRVVLDDMSFVVRPGQTVALVGQSGAGKSTIVNLLLRFFDPWKGSVQIDGQDIRRFKLESFRSQMSVVPQDTILFHRTIRENIAYGKPDAAFEEIVRAAREAEIHDFIAQLPNGYDTLLEESATNLSGGQKQRLALARGILRDTPLLIMDEPVTQLDSITESRLNKTIAHVTRDKTTFIIAHRLTTIQRADLILVIDKGVVVEHGTQTELVSKSGFYRKLYETEYLSMEPVVDPG